MSQLDDLKKAIRRSTKATPDPGRNDAVSSAALRTAIASGAKRAGKAKAKRR